MASNQSLSLDQRLSMRLSAQQLRFVKLLEYNTPELEEAVERELDDNPALEVAEENEPADLELPSYRYGYSGGQRATDESANYDFSPPDLGENLYDSLLRQLAERNLSPNVLAAAEYIVGSLDSNGYLRRSLGNLINDMAFGPGIDVTETEAKEALDTVQDLEPYGVGAADLRECLRLQLVHLPQSQRRDDAIDIIDKQFEAFTMKHTHRIISGLKIDRERAKEAVDLILSLNPKPGAAVNTDRDSANIIVPDLVVWNEDGNLSVMKKRA